jgi:phenylalanyl-tRNA synthetase beta chain
VALAGVIGGADSAISETTKHVVLESANFQATSVRLTSARHKLRTDASMRFEKALDPENTIRGLARAVELFREVCPGILVRGGVSDERGPLPEHPAIALPVAFVVRKLGKDVTQQRITGILNALGFDARETTPGVLTVTVPSWRATKDISIKDDLVEEIGRMVGYAEIAPAAPLVLCAPPYTNPSRTYVRRVRSELASQGFTEVYNYSFVAEDDVKRFGFRIADHAGVQNPIASEQTHLRRSLLPGIYRNIVDNVRHYPEFRLFEIGHEIHPAPSRELPMEISHVAAALYNAHRDDQDFFEMKRVLECVFRDVRVTPARARECEHPVRAAEVHWRGSVIGRLFELHPSLLADHSIEGQAVLFDVDLDLAHRLSTAKPIRYVPLRRYPTTGFDLSVVTTLLKPVAEIQEDLTRLAGPDLASIDFIRQYDGPPLEAGQKSVSYRLAVGAPDHTMTNEEGREIRDRIMEGMRGLGYEFRG